MDSIRRAGILVIACVLMALTLLTLSACAPGITGISMAPGTLGSAGFSVLAKVRAGEMSVRTAADFADFLDRHSKARPSVERASDGFVLRARSSASLREVTFAVPLDPGSRVVSASGFPVRVKDGWAYVTVDRDMSSAEIRVVVAREGGTN